MDNNVNVLIVDDEQSMRILMKRIILNIGYNVIAEGTDGEEAVNLYKKHLPEIVLLDLNMPVMSGEDALKSIKEFNQNACVIILSSISKEETMTLCMKLGATCYIRKDYQLTEIENTIKEAWEAFSLLKTAAN